MIEEAVAVKSPARRSARLLFAANLTMMTMMMMIVSKLVDVFINDHEAAKGPETPHRHRPPFHITCASRHAFHSPCKTMGVNNPRVTQ